MVQASRGDKASRCLLGLTLREQTYLKLLMGALVCFQRVLALNRMTILAVDAQQRVPTAALDAQQRVPAAALDAQQRVPDAALDAQQRVLTASLDAQQRVPAADFIERRTWHLARRTWHLAHSSPAPVHAFTRSCVHLFGR